MVLKLPPVDVYRAPFVEPIGHLAMQAAYAEEQLAALCAAIPFKGSNQQMTEEEAAHQLRNWGSRAEAFVTARLNLLDPETRALVAEPIARYIALRDRRHRVIHDAVTLGLWGEGKETYVQPLGSEFRRDGQQTTRILNPITPEDVADLACQMHDAYKDIEFWTWQIDDLPSSEDD